MFGCHHACFILAPNSVKVNCALSGAASSQVRRTEVLPMCNRLARLCIMRHNCSMMPPKVMHALVVRAPLRARSEFESQYGPPCSHSLGHITAARRNRATPAARRNRAMPAARRNRAAPAARRNRAVPAARRNRARQSNPRPEVSGT